MEDVAQCIVRYFNEVLVDAAGRPACALVRFYKTHAYGALPLDLRAVASRGMAGLRPWDEMKCLTLLGTQGEEPAFCDRRTSSGHKVIPLPSVEFVARIPMIHRLVVQLGLDLASVLAPDPTFLLDVEQKTFNVFHVAEAKGSPFIPAQDFVERHGIRSVVGFGGLLINGDLFTVVLFAKVNIARETAELFVPMALGVKLALHPFIQGHTFAYNAAA